MGTSLFNITERTALCTPQLIRTNRPIYKILIQPTKGGKRNKQVISNIGSNKRRINGIVTEFALKNETRTVWSYTLGDDVYAYTAGESLWDMTVGGFGYIDCRLKNGIDDLINFYGRNNLSDTGLPCKIILGNHRFLAYLVEGSFGSYSEPHTPLFPFSFKFKVLPTK